MMLTSAELPPATFVAVIEVLFSSLSSGVWEETTTVLISVVPAALGEPFTTMSNCATVPAVSVAIEQLTVPVDPADGVVQPNVGPVVCVYERNATSAGRGAVKVAPAGWA